METVNTPSTLHSTRHQVAWLDELSQLLTRPVDMEHGVSRQGSMLGVHLTPLPRTDRQTVDLTVTVFFVHLSLPQPEEERADAVAFQVFLRGLHHEDPQLRIAACEALGQLGNTEAKEALQQAAQEENQYVRRAAARALNTLDRPHTRKEELAGVRLTLWQQVRHLWKPLGTATTDRQGRARFANIPAGSRCRVQTLPHEQAASGIFAARLLSVFKSGELAAESVEASEQTLPRSHCLALPDGNLLCTLYRNDREEIVVEFRSDAPRLRGGWVHVTAINTKTKEQALSEFVVLEPDERGVLTARLVLSNIVELQHEHEFHFAPLPLPPEAE
jgi:hypothetical protein